MNLRELYQSLLDKGIIRRSREATIKSSLKRYASILGSDDLASCPEDSYNLDQAHRNKLISKEIRRITKSGSGKMGLSARAVINIKNDVSFVLRNGIALSLISPPVDSARHSPVISTAFYKGTKNREEFRRGESKWLPSIAISEADLPPRLRKDLDEYYEWATEEFISDRPHTRKRRPITATLDRGILRRVAGFHIHYCGVALEELSAESLIKDDMAKEYIKWLVAHHRRVTANPSKILISLICLADYLLIIATDEDNREAIAQTAGGLRRIKESLPSRVKVRDKKKYWLPLEEIDKSGVSRYPRNATHLTTVSTRTRRKLQTLPGTERTSLKYLAVRALQSLLVRLLVRIPLRLRNFREMCWNPHRPEEGKNLFRKGDTWYIRFSGRELKIAARGGKINSVQHRIPKSLTWLVEEVLTIWRPIITGVPCHLLESGTVGDRVYEEPPETCAPKYKEAPQDVLLFISASCTPTTPVILRNWVMRTTYAYTKVAVYPHLVRDIWATTYIKKKRDFIGAAKRLGDTVETVIKHYAHLLDEEAEADGDAFNRSVFGEEEQD